MTTRIGQALGDCEGGELLFTVPAGVAKGDLLVAGIITFGSNPWVSWGSDLEWTLHDNLTVSGWSAGLWTVEADGSEAGEVTRFLNVGSACGGVLVAYRGAYLLPPLVPGVTARTLTYQANATNHVAVGTEGTQSSDRRLAFWLVGSTPTFTEAEAPGFTSFGQFNDPGVAKVAGGEYLAFLSGTSADLTAVSSANAEGLAAMWSLRMRPVARPVGVSDAVPGTIGLIG